MYYIRAVFRNSNDGYNTEFRHTSFARGLLFVVVPFGRRDSPLGKKKKKNGKGALLHSHGILPGKKTRRIVASAAVCVYARRGRADGGLRKSTPPVEQKAKKPLRPVLPASSRGPRQEGRGERRDVKKTPPERDPLADR